MPERNKTAVEVLVVVLLLFAAWRLHDMTAGFHPYSFYQFGRLIVFAAWGGSAYVFWQRRIHVVAFLSVIMALWFNPFMPVHMRRFEWAPYDVLGMWLSLICALGLAWLSYKARTKTS